MVATNRKHAIPVRITSICWLVALVVMAIGLLTGCGEKRYPVVGRVTYDDGTAFTHGGAVLFEMGDGIHSRMLRAELQADGSYRTDTVLSGLRPGIYRVALVAPEFDPSDFEPDPKPVDGQIVDIPPEKHRPVRVPQPPPIPFDKKFLNFATSGLSLKVAPGMREFNISLGPRK